MMINKKQMWSDSPFNQWTEEELLCMKYQGICYGKGGGSAPPPPPATQTVRQSSEFPEELKPFVSDIFCKAQAIQEQRQEEGFRPELTQQLAAFTPDQQAAFTGIREQVGQTRPLFEEATQLTRGATRAATDPAEVAALMNPFLRNVTDIEKREAQRVADVEEQQLAAQAARAGAFGGSRAAILEAERQRNLAQKLGDIEARGRLAAFQDAQARLQNQFGREAAGAAQLSALGTAIPAQTFKELGALSGIGAAEQQQAQRALDIATQQAREEYGFPMQTLQDFQSILRGFPLPATTNVSKQTFSPAQPLSTQLLGLGTGLAGLAGAAGAFKKAGGLVGAPVAMKNGGYVKLAGGGGLGQLMQGNVQRYQKGGQTQVETLSRLSLEELQSLLNSPDSPFSPKLIQDAIDVKQAETNVAGNLATRAISEAAQTMREEYPLRIPPRVDRTPPPEMAELDVKPPTPLGFGKLLAPDAMGLRERKIQEETEGGVGAEFARIGGKDDLPMISSGTPIKDAIANAANTVGGKLISTLDQRINPTAYDDPAARIAPGDSPEITILEKLKAEYPLRIPPRVDRTSDTQSELNAGMLPMQPLPATPANFGATSTVMGGSYDPVSRGSAQRVTAPSPPAAPQLISAELTDATGLPVDAGGGQKLSDFQLAGMVQGKELPDQRRYTAAAGPSIADRFLGTRFGSDVSSLFEGESRDEYIRRISQPKRAMLSIGELGSKIGSYFGDSPEKFEEGQRERELKLAQRQAEIDARKLDPLSDIRDPKGIEKAIDPDPVDFNIKDALDAEQKRADAVREKVQDTDPAAAESPPAKAPAGTKDADPLTRPADGGAAADGATNKGAPSPGTNSAQIDYNAKIAEFKDKDYSAEVEKALGPAPTYEKGEEPDFASQKYLTLLGVSARILSSNKPALQALGDAVQPAIKELADIGKEERKIQRELRQERNAQKRADYQDKSARLNMQRQLRGDDIDMFTGLARLREQQESNKISAENAETNRNRMLSENAARKVQRLEKEFTFRLEKEGKLSYGDVDKLIDSVLKRSSKAAMVGAKDTLTNLTDPTKIEEFMSAAYQSELPFLLDRIDGRVIGKDGKTVVPRSELMKLLGMKTAPAPRGGGRTTYTAGQGAPKKKAVGE